MTGTLTATGGDLNSSSGFPGGTTPYTLELTVNGGKTDIPYLNKEAKTVLPQQTIYIVADDPPEGQQFVRWDVEPEELASLLGDIHSDSVSFGMLEQNTTVTLTAVYEDIPKIPEEGLCLNDGSIGIREEAGRVMAYQNDSQYIVPDGEIRITGNGTPTENTIYVDDANIHITLAGIDFRSNFTECVDIENSDVTLTLEGNNTMLTEDEAIYVEAWGGDSKLTIDGPGALTIGSVEERGSYGIYIDEASTIINGGVLNIYARNAAIRGRWDASLTVNGGVIRGNVSGGNRDYSGLGVSGNPSDHSMDITIHGGTVELTGSNDKISTSDSNSVVITGGSVTAGGVKPAPTDGNGNAVYPVAFETATGDVDAFQLKKGDAVHSYGLPARTATDGSLTLYLPEGEYSGMAVIGGKLVKFDCTSAVGTGNPSAAADTGHRFTCPEGKKPVINTDGTVTLPGGSLIQTSSGNTLLVPGGGGVFDPDIGELKGDPIQPQPVEYTVTFDAQGGRVTPAAMKTAGGKLQSLPTPTRSSYTFEGWFTQASGGEKITTNTSFNADITIYAHWNYGGSSSNGGGWYNPPATYAVTAPNTANGKVTVSPTSASRGTTVTISAIPEDGCRLDTLNVTSGGKSIPLTEKGSGKYTFTMPAGTVKVEAVFVLAETPETPWNHPFAGVSEDDWYYEAVRFVQNRGLMSGYSDGRFGPNDPLSRAQLAQILFNKEGKPVVNYLMDFSDVAGEAWYTEAVRWAASQGIVGGYGNGMFGPNDPITREQLAVMLWRYSGSPAATNKELYFNGESEISGFALEAMHWAMENNILNGYSDGRLGPQGQATRAQVAQMLKNFIENQEQTT